MAAFVTSRATAAGIIALGKRLEAMGINDDRPVIGRIGRFSIAWPILAVEISVRKSVLPTVHTMTVTDKTIGRGAKRAKK